LSHFLIRGGYSTEKQEQKCEKESRLTGLDENNCKSLLLLPPLLYAVELMWSRGKEGRLPI